jgi:alcohol dehydrogenase (cytochrome c)
VRALIIAAALLLVVLPVAVSVQSDADRRAPAGKNWPVPGGDLNFSRYSTLSQINRSNIKSLGGAWAAELGTEVSKSAAVVQDGVMYFHTQQQVIALDARTGTTLWAYKPPVLFNGSARGVTVAGGLVFAGLSDTSVVALRADTGDPAWIYKGADVAPGNGYISSPPAVGNGVAVIPISGGDGYLRGRIIGVDVRTGKELWTFFAVPGPGDAGHETWPANSDVWRYGGGAVWMTPSIDLDLGLAYVGTGNAVPTWGGEVRPGDNLYTSSVVALELRTGKLRWHYQLVHHELWEADQSTPLILYDAALNGRTRKALAVMRTDGYLFQLDRATGKPIFAVEERAVPQDPSQKTAATQPFPIGADRVGPDCTPAELLPPGFKSGCYFDVIRTDVPNSAQPHMTARFAPMAYSPQTGHFYVTTCADPKLLLRGEDGWGGLTGTFLRPPGFKLYGEIVALNGRTNRIAWRKRSPYSICVGSGAMATAGGLVFHAEPDGNLQAYDAANGDLLWQFQMGVVGASAGLRVNGGGPVMTFEAGGEQYVALAMNRIVWAFKLGGTVPPRPAPPPPFTVQPWEGRIAEVDTIELTTTVVQTIRTANRRVERHDEYAFNPARVQATFGTSVRFVNTGKSVHTIAARDGSWTTGPIKPGESAAVSVARPGEYEYVCSDHLWSIGQLIVK